MSHQTEEAFFINVEYLLQPSTTVFKQDIDKLDTLSGHI